MRLDELPGSGPQGPAGPAGPEGPPGSDADTSQFYSKTQTNTLLTAKQNNIVSTPGSGTVLFNNGLMRRFVSGSNVTLSIDSNDNLVVAATGGGSGSIPSTIAEFLNSQIIHKAPTSCGQGLTVTHTLITDFLNTGTVRSN